MERHIERKVYLGADSIVAASGFSTPEVVGNIEAGRSGCRETDDRRLWGDAFIAGSVDDTRLDEASAGLDGYTRLERMFILNIREVLERSGVDPTDPKTLLVVSTTKGNIDGLGDGPDFPETVYLWEMARRIAGFFGFVQEPTVISNACISGISAAIVGMRLIKEGRCDNVVIAGGDLMSRFTVTGFQAFKSVSRELCRPYDISRDGLTLGEGCAALLLTSDERKATQPMVELAGGSVSNDANHISGPSRTGDGLYYAIRGAMREAGAGGNGFVNGHGTATVYNDEMESKALELAGLRELPVNSLKPWLGHTLGAAGVVETILCAHQLRAGVVCGTPGFAETGTPYRLNVSAEHRSMPLDFCVKTASGFGGCNAAVVLARTTEDRAPQGGVECERTCAYSLSSDGEPFAERIRREFKALDAPNVKFYKMDDMCKLGYVAAENLLAGRGLSDKYRPEEIGIVLANRSSSLDTDLRHHALVEQDTAAASPSVFVYTLPNIVSGEICLRHKIQGDNTFFVQAEKDMDAVRDYGRMLLGRGVLKAVVCGWCELLGEDYDAEFELWENITVR